MKHIVLILALSFFACKNAGSVSEDVSASTNQKPGISFDAQAGGDTDTKKSVFDMAGLPTTIDTSLSRLSICFCENSFCGEEKMAFIGICKELNAVIYQIQCQAYCTAKVAKPACVEEAKLEYKFENFKCHIRLGRRSGYSCGFSFGEFVETNIQECNNHVP